MGNGPPQLAALALFAEINARVDAGESRVAVLREKGLSEGEFQQEQERWLSLLAARAQQQQWQLQQRYSALYAQWRLRDDSEHTPPMPFVVGPLLGSPVARPSSNDFGSPTAQVLRPASIHSDDEAYVPPRDMPAYPAPAPIHSPAPDASAFGSPFPFANAPNPPQQRFESPVSTTPPFTSSSSGQPPVETRSTALPDTTHSNVARAPLFVSGPTALPAQDANVYTSPAQQATANRELVRTHVASNADAQPVQRATATLVQHSASGVTLSFEQLTCLTAELQVKPDQAAETLRGYGVDETGYQAQQRDLLVRCEADEHLSQRYQRLLQYYRSIVSQR